MIPVAAACPDTKRLAALTVELTKAVDTHAETAFCDTTDANTPPDMARPCRASRLARIVLALANLPDRVPSDQPSCLAASLRVRPSRSQRTTGTRYFSERRLNSLSRRDCKSLHNSGGGAWDSGSL